MIDSEPLWRRSEIEIFGGVGLVLRESDCERTQGLRIDEAVAYWYERKPWSGATCDDVADEIVARVAELIRSEGKLMPGARRALNWASGSDWRLALASASPSFLIETAMEKLGIGEPFEVIRSAEGEAAGKPHPGVYLSTARDLGLPPAACVAIEDSANGVASALAAGMRCFAVPAPADREDPRFLAAAAILSSLAELEDAVGALRES